MSSQQNQQEEDPNFKYDPVRKMLACKIFGKEDLRMVDSPVPMVADPADAVIRITASAICGSDLHMYHARTPGGEFNNIIGHECVGIVDEVGSGVSKLKKGDRVVVSAVLCCGSCEYCQRQEWSCCDITLVNKALAAHPSGCHSGSLLGFSHRLGGYDGCQAEYVRVPFADVNCFPIPNDVDDKQALTIADVACTGYHGTQLADIKEGDDVAVFGAGPVGLMAQMWAVYRGANKVIAMDIDDYRLGFAKKNFGVETINLNKVDPVTEVRKYFPKGPNKVIDCAGYIPPAEEPKVKKGLYPEASTLMTLNAAIAMIRKNGRISLIGKYVGYLNNFHIGGMMEKHLTISGGQVWPQAYYPAIFKAIQSGKVNPGVVFTHKYPLSQCDQAYRKFDRHEDGIIKALLVPDSILSKRNGKF